MARVDHDRRPHAVYRQGSEPDPRFSMANERTALSWVRTSLAFVAGGVGLTSVVRIADLPGLVDVVAAVMCLLGGWLAVSAVLGWRRREVALRLNKEMPPPVALPLVSAVIGLTSIVLAVLVLMLGKG